QEDGIAVRLAGGDSRGRNALAAAGLVLDNDRLAPFLGKRLPQRSRDHVGDTARAIGNDNLYGLRRVILCRSQRSKGKHGHAQTRLLQESKNFHVVSSVVLYILWKIRCALA